MKENKGVTLVALVITIIILLLLSGVAIATITGQNGVIENTNKAVSLAKQDEAKDQEIINKVDEMFKKYVKTDTPTITVTIDGENKTITKDNVHQYLGKKVTNYTGQSTVEINEESYTVSTEYRLYYVDFDDKYDGTGTIYLKAGSTQNGSYMNLWDDTNPFDNIVLKTLNPLLAQLVENGASWSTNLYMANYLLNTSYWQDLADTSMTDNINYIVGAPTLEMMIDSYNTCYELTGDTPIGSETTPGEKQKLLYRYKDAEYEVGLSGSSSGFSDSVDLGESVGTMYKPGGQLFYPLATNSSEGLYVVMDHRIRSMFKFNIDHIWDTCSLCPVVSLKPNTILQLESNS